MNNSFSNSRRKIKKKSLSRENSKISFTPTKQKKEKLNLKEIFLYSWGKNKNGELGLGTTSNIVPYPSPITSLTTKNIISVKPGGRNTILIRQDGTIYLCGSNIFGLLAEEAKVQNNQNPVYQNNLLNQKTFKNIKYFEENEKNIKEISIAEFHCLALDDKGEVLGWGGNLFNKLGEKSDFTAGKPIPIIIKNKIKSISCGDYHSCALSEDGILYTWGGGGESYNRGQCGHGNRKDIQKPKKVGYFIKNDIKIKKVCCGGYHTIVISDDDNNNELYSFGKGIFGQLGHGKPEDSSLPKKIIFNEKQNIKYENNEKINITDIKCGGEHSLFLSSNNKLYVCGHGYLGQLGLGNDKNINSPLIVFSLTNKKIIEIAAGWSHSLVLTDEGNVYSTGCNKYGELGLGKEYNKYNFSWISKLSKLNIKHISAGGHHSWCLLDNEGPLRKNKNMPQPLLKNNFTMKKKIQRKLSSKSNNSNDDSSNRWDKKSHNDKSALSVDNTTKRKFKNYKEEGFGTSNKRKKSLIKLKRIIDDYNNENEMSVDDLIDGIDKINNNDDNQKSENSEDIISEHDGKIIFNDNIIKDINLECDLKIIYTDLNLSHRFIRFQSTINKDKIKSIIIENIINKDDAIISFQFQRDDEIEKNNSISNEIFLIYNTIKSKNLINTEELGISYTLGITYDYKKNKNIMKYESQFNKFHDINKKPFYGFKFINSKEILKNDENIENKLSSWIINFNKIYNKNLVDEKDKISKKDILFMELRPNIFNFYSQN